MRFRITVRGEGVELRGYMDADDSAYRLHRFSSEMKPYGIVVASPAEVTYDPFMDQSRREIHHFETEEMLAAVKAILASNEDDAVRLNRIGLIVGGG